MGIYGLVVHACAVERVNKTHGRIHSESRASLAPKSIQRALYIHTNEALLHKFEHDARLKVARAQRAVKVASASDLDALAPIDLASAEDILSAVAALDVGEFLPAENQGESVDDDDTAGGGDEDELGGTAHRLYLDAFEVPEGYFAVEKPAAFLGMSVIEGEKHYLLLCHDDLPWGLGRIVKYKPRATKYKFDVAWDPNEVHQQGVKLENYYDFEAVLGAELVPGSWIFLKNAAALALQRTRLRDELAANGDDENSTTRHRANESDDEIMYDSSTER